MGGWWIKTHLRRRSDRPDCGAGFVPDILQEHGRAVSLDRVLVRRRRKPHGCLRAGPLFIESHETAAHGRGSCRHRVRRLRAVAQLFSHRVSVTRSGSSSLSEAWGFYATTRLPIARLGFALAGGDGRGLLLLAERCVAQALLGFAAEPFIKDFILPGLAHVSVEGRQLGPHFGFVRRQFEFDAQNDAAFRSFAEVADLARGRAEGEMLELIEGQVFFDFGPGITGRTWE